ncbi:Spy/CpxP family protein refolding chaperone [Bacteroidota bacterium]
MVLMITGANTNAQQGKNYSDQGRGLNRDHVCERIPDLTEEQQTKIKDLRLDQMKKMTDFRNQMNELQAKKQTLMTSDNSDMKEINSVIDQMTNVHNKMMKTSAQHHQDVRNLLTDEQKVIFDSMPRRGRRHGKGMRNDHGHGRGAMQGAGYGRGND